MAVCRQTGLLAIEIMADASTSSVVIALEIMQTYCGDFHGITMDPGSCLVPLSKHGNQEQDSDQEAEEGEVIEEKLNDFEEYAISRRIEVKVSAPK